MRLMDKPDNKNNEVAELLAMIDRGEAGALDDLVSLVYPELKKLAHFQLSGERPGHTLNTTAIVHEAFVRRCHFGCDQFRMATALICASNSSPLCNASLSQERRVILAIMRSDPSFNRSNSMGPDEG